ncbi:MAG TPA: protein kinase [Myxococcaceae bacterium]|nr:protein kinase [Myxococcaceae bacterium]
MQRLSPGTQFDSWRVESWHSQGAYGAVYRAVRIGQEHLGPVALKLSVYPWDWRFAREAELLSRLSHPSIPRLLGRGVFRHPSGAAEHPFLVMEWVEGTPLYAWAERHALSGPEVCRVLAQLARALEAIHAAGAVHRDVKGDNVLVRLSDNLPVLIDFGSCYFEGAQRLTWESLAPFTPEYLSPQACLFDIRLARNRDTYYVPSPADDLYALGVTAYRLVMGQYPPPMDVQQDGEGSWRVSPPDPRPLLESNPRVDPRLRHVILRLLSEAPEARGTADQAAQPLEAMASASVPTRLPAPPPATALPPTALAPARGGERPAPVRPLGHSWTWAPWLTLVTLGVCVVLLWNWWSPPRVPTYVSESTQQASGSHAPDAGTTAVGDSSPAAPQPSSSPPTDTPPIAQEAPPKPRPGQAEPDERGRCPAPKQVPLNGGCWVELSSMTAEECAGSGGVIFKGKCYVAPLAPPKSKKPPPTSSPADAR